jgi:hypothetical protein
MLLTELRDHIRDLETRLGKLDAYILDAMAPYAQAHQLSIFQSRYEPERSGAG